MDGRSLTPSRLGVVHALIAVSAPKEQEQKDNEARKAQDLSLTSPQIAVVTISDKVGDTRTHTPPNEVGDTRTHRLGKTRHHNSHRNRPHSHRTRHRSSFRNSRIQRRHTPGSRKRHRADRDMDMVAGSTVDYLG